jgi:hypothetical protein
MHRTLSIGAEVSRSSSLPIGVVGVAGLGATLSLGWAGRLNNRSLGLIFRMLSSTVHGLLGGWVNLPVSDYRALGLTLGAPG